MKALFALLLLSAPAVAQDGGPVAGAVVRSKEWKIRRAPQREEEFIGDVSYRRGPSVLDSDWALLRHETLTWEARVRVRLAHGLRSGDRIEVSGARAFYDQKTQKGRLLPAPGAAIEFRRTPVDGEPDQGVAAQLDWVGQDLVRLSGVARAGAALSVGKANTDERLLLALRILQKLRRTPALVSRRFTEINVADPQQIRFVLDDELEVRCGSEPELDAHLSRLRASLRAVSHQPFPVGYIDVRFQEPVVGPRT